MSTLQLNWSKTDRKHLTCTMSSFTDKGAFFHSTINTFTWLKDLNSSLLTAASLSAEPTAGFSHIHVLYAWLQTHRDLAVAALFGRAGSGEALASHQHKLVWASMAVCVYRAGAERAACAQRGVVFLFLFIYFVSLSPGARSIAWLSTGCGFTSS